jgi:hypothetical protein
MVVLASCSSIAPSSFSHDIDELLGRGAAYARSLSVRPAAELRAEDIVALGYLERARLGLGSPFRLIAFAGRDERLTPETRERLAYAILNLTLQSRGYQVDATILDVLPLMGVPGGVRLGDYHVQLIQRTVAESPSATSGERAVRLGYLLAGTERTVDAATEPVVAYVAALVADRRRAREDAVALLRAAAQQKTDPLELLEDWRKELRFRVEAPAMAQVTASEEMTEAVKGSQVAASLRLLAQRMNAPSAAHRMPRANPYWRRTWLSAAAAERLHELADSLDYPAQAPVAVSVIINREALIGRPGLTEWQKRQRAAFADAAINEEKLVAAAGLLSATPVGQGPRLSLILLQSGVFLRGWNQEEPWFPGDPAPSGRDLENRFGLAGVSFDADIPEAWRPYYRRMLGRSLGELQRVLPTTSLRGLRIRVGTTAPEDAVLALHDPRSRTLILPPRSGAGTLAHEIAHDLDWQLARKRYGRRGSYATDVAVNHQKGDRLAASVAGLAVAFAREGGTGSSTQHDRRPAEVFARGLDWLVAAQLASEGRTGGYVTSFQDAALAGYGTTRGPQLDGNAVPALLTILDQIAPVPPETRQWAEDTYGPTRTLTAKELVRAIGTTSAEGTVFARFTALEQARNRALEGLSAASCRMTPSPRARQLVAARQEVIHTAVAATARGIVIDGVRSVATELAEKPARTAVDEFLVWRLDGGPEPTDSSVHLLQPAADELILWATGISSERPAPARAFELNPERTLCGGNPFASRVGERHGSGFPFARSRR